MLGNLRASREFGCIRAEPPMISEPINKGDEATPDVGFVVTSMTTRSGLVTPSPDRLTLLASAVAPGMVVVGGVYIGALHPVSPKESAIPAQCGPEVMIRPDLLGAETEPV